MSRIIVEHTPVERIRIVVIESEGPDITLELPPEKAEAFFRRAMQVCFGNRERTEVSL